MKKLGAYVFSWAVMTALCFALFVGVEVAFALALSFLAWEWIPLNPFFILSVLRLNFLFSAGVGIAFAFSKENKPFVDGVVNGTDTTDR